MKTIYLLTIAAFLSILLCSCGGVIGSIEKYRFQNISLDSLKGGISKVYATHPELKDFDTLKYQQGLSIGDGDYYCTATEKGTKYLFKYAFPKYDSPYDTIVEVSLSSAAPYGQGLNLASKLGFFEKRKYKKLFTQYFIEAVSKEVGRRPTRY